LTILNQKIKELQSKGAYSELIKILESSKQQEKDSEKILIYEFQLADANFNLRNFPTAKERTEGLVLAFTKQENYEYLGESENLIGKIYRIYQRYDEALKHYRNAENAFQRCNNNEGLSKVYHNIGNVFIFLEKFKESKKFHLKALELAKNLKNDDMIANSYLNLGSMHYQNGEVDDALKYYENAQFLLEKQNNIPSLAVVYLNLAESYFLRKNYPKASSLSAKSVLNYKELGNVIGQALALQTFAKTEKEQKNFDNAISSYKEIISLQEPNAKEEIYLELGECYIEMKDADSAIKSYEAILNLSESSPQGKGFALNFLAALNGEKRNFSKAVEYYEQLIMVLQTIPSRDEESIAATRGNLGYMLLRLGKIKESYAQLDSALKYFKKKKIWEDSIILVNNYMSELIRTSRYTEGISFLRKYSIPLAEKSKDKNLTNKYVYEVALLHHINEDTLIGLSFWEKYHKKNPFQQYKPSFLNNLELEEEQRKFLEQSHHVFLQSILDQK
jgi:tetratricopeptide (TPR) repeat protein